MTEAKKQTMEEKLKILDITHKAIEKQFGKNTINRLDASAYEPVPSISTGILELDDITGVGGYPVGRIIELSGAEASGKTTVALHAIAETQKNGGICAFIDVEHSLDTTYANSLGVNLKDLWLSQPDYGEQALEVVDSLVQSGVVDLIIVDSVSALVPLAELEGEMGDQQMALQARLMSKAMRKLSGVISKTSTICLFISQLRDNIGGYGPKKVTGGGNSLKFYSSIRLDVKRIETVVKGTDAVGTMVRIETKKNKVSAPFRKCEVENEFGKGFTKANSIINLGVKYECIQKAGSWYSIGEERIGQGKDNVKKYFNEHPEMLSEIEVKVREAMKPEIMVLDEPSKPEPKVRKKKGDFKNEPEIELPIEATE